MSDDLRERLLAAIDNTAHHAAGEYSITIPVRLARQIAALLAGTPEEHEALRLETESGHTVEDCIGALVAMAARRHKHHATLIEAEVLATLRAGAPEEETREHYWCGCHRHVRWERCEAHAGMEDDEVPPSQEGRPRRRRAASAPSNDAEQYQCPCGAILTAQEIVRNWNKCDACADERRAAQGEP